MFNFTPFLDELFTPGQAVTATATEDIKLGQLVEIVAADGLHTTAKTPQLAVRVATPGAVAFGLAGHDVEKGGDLTVQRGAGRCFRVPAKAPHMAGDLLEVAEAGGFAQASTGAPVAQAIRNSEDGHVDVTLL